MSSSSPSTILSEALSAFSRSANLAVSAAVSEEATRANARIHELRKERDDAIQKSYDAEMEIERWKTSVAKAELTVRIVVTPCLCYISEHLLPNPLHLTFDSAYAFAPVLFTQVSHQTETITQLTREIQQWQDQTQTWQEQSQHWQTQCRHLSETSRLEIQGWKEQYLQAEKERVRLMDRLDDLIKSHEVVAQRRLQTPHSHTPNPKTLYPTPRVDGTGSSTSINRRMSMSHSAVNSSSESTLAHESPEDIHAATKVVAQSSKRVQKPALPSSAKGKQIATTQTAPNTRTTQATPNVRPSRPAQAAPRTTSVAHPQQQPQQPSQPRTQVIRRVQAVVEIPIKEESDDGGEDSRPSSSSGSVAQPSTSTRVNVTAKGRSRQPAKGAPQNGNAHRENGDSDLDDLGSDDSADSDYGDEDEDELMLGAEDDDQDDFRMTASKRKRRRSLAIPKGNTGRSAPKRRHR
ncbi:hypothetical protein NEOLEDRAFT_548514 [Neolentinus lepideus HHB14362 ss-1]|uniref:Uncharacterized protein n=1 Tax=Neolentinus lepideus HHB14362 ss-1 TaxID=1314782 RepID=A0A165R8E3_9AGAM|nr:hypothetical protein NEOLEDRAFT_548514 [Neolentinus lepideus HHB14362 ss-1]